MRRYPPHDPKEYIDWQPDSAVQSAYRQTIDESSTLPGRIAAADPALFGRLYTGLVRSRLYDIALKRWVRTGVLTKAWLGLGEEASTIGALEALAAEDPVGPMIRNQSAAFQKGIPLEDCFKVYLGTGDTITRGRDLHIGDLNHHVVCPISHVGDLVPVMAGFALSFKMRGEDRVALTWTGEGATRTGTVHEGLAVAASARVPLIVVVQDNHVALGTRRDDKLRSSLESIAASHGVTGLRCDGNHVLDVYDTIATARELCLAGEGPVVVYSRTFRMGGHATHDEAEARELFSGDEFADWGKRDPVGCFEEYLRSEPALLGVKTAKAVTKKLEKWEAAVTEEVESAAAVALESKKNHPPDPTTLLDGVVA